ncbi:type II secretion system F family protein [Prosthecomicrobium sp. N25]|uniref:type II secretion system F family protein n=1 Tax=Prosthecomicrobium sp. N25 TaxID=3129254 RepID=UPI003076E472
MLDQFETFLAGSDAISILPGAMLFLAVAAVTIAVGQLVQSRGAIRRRAADVGSLDIAVTAVDPRSPLGESRAAAAKLLDSVTRNFVPEDVREVVKIRRQLMQAGFLQPGAVAWYFAARFGAAIVVGLAASATAAALGMAGAVFWLVVLGGLILGYLLPSIYVGRRVARNRDEHRAGFPDFMDLMVVCADAGLSMESALDRVGRELSTSYPSLSANLAMTNLEMRAGRTLGEALDMLGDRLGITEARSFATLLQQSEELGSSLTEALRIYSDDMRHQRLSRAEEKAYALPAKLVIPLGLFVFPVLLIVTILPVYIRLKGYSN